MNAHQVRRKSHLLTHSRLSNAQRLRNLSLTHARGKHRAQRNSATQTGDLLVASRIRGTPQKCHKTILSRILDRTA